MSQFSNSSYYTNNGSNGQPQHMYFSDYDQSKNDPVYEPEYEPEYDPSEEDLSETPLNPSHFRQPIRETMKNSPSPGSSDSFWNKALSKKYLWVTILVIFGFFILMYALVYFFIIRKKSARKSGGSQSSMFGSGTESDTSSSIFGSGIMKDLEFM